MPNCMQWLSLFAIVVAYNYLLIHSCICGGIMWSMGRRHSCVSLVWLQGLPSIAQHHELKPPLSLIQGIGQFYTGPWIFVCMSFIGIIIYIFNFFYLTVANYYSGYWVLHCFPPFRIPNDICFQFIHYSNYSIISYISWNRDIVAGNFNLIAVIINVVIRHRAFYTCNLW